MEGAMKRRITDRAMKDSEALALYEEGRKTKESQRSGGSPRSACQ